MTTATKSPKRFNCNVRDAKEPFKVHVKPEDIKGAVCRDHQRCAVARAIRRQRKSAEWVDVGAKVVVIGTGKKTAVRYVLPKAACDQVRYFDTHEGAFAPCTIKLTAPPEPLAAGARKGANARSGKRKTKATKTRQVPTR